jgi:PAS domain S-box-containing protein
MLAALLRELTPALVRTVEARAGAGPESAGASAGRPERAFRLLRGLVSALENRTIEEPAGEPAGQLERHLETVRLLKDAVYAAIDDLAPQISPREVRFVADWFAAQAEHALRTENRQYAALLDSLPDQLFLHDLDVRLLIVNRAKKEALSAATGLPLDRLIGRDLIDEVEMPAPFKQYIRGCIERVRNGETVTEEFLEPSTCGGRWREHHGAPVYDAQGRVIAVAVSSRDIHAHKVAEARLQLLSKIGALAATADYEDFVGGLARLSLPELADWCVVDVVGEGRVRRRVVAHRDPTAQALADELLRLAPDRPRPVIDSHCLALEPRVLEGLDHPQLLARDPQLFELGQRLGVSTAIVVPLPVLRSPAAVATFVFAPEWGRRHGPDDLAVAQEVARRAAQTMENAHLQEKLRQSEARFRVALSRANIAVFEQDTELRFRWSYNLPLAENDQAAIGRNAADFLPPEALARTEAWKRKVLETGQGVRGEIDFDVRGERRYFLANSEPVHGPRGIVGITGAIVDITDTKRAQEALAQAVSFRDRLIGILGHDLRNPLSSVLALARVLRQQDGVPDRVRQGLDRIAQSAGRMNEMIGTVLDFTNLRFRGEVPLSLNTVALDALAHTIVEELRAAHPDRAIEIATQGDVRGRWDEGRLGQVLSNLVANALTHGAHAAAVQVSLSREKEGAVLAVTNRGPAISAELQERLFEPFWQGPRNGGPPRSGLGLGLFITREIVRAHGGSIEVRSRDGATTFTVRLPLQAVPHSQVA